MQSGFELLKTSPEALKNYIFDKLAQRPARVVAFPEKRRRIYLICEQRDFDSIRPIQEYLAERQVRRYTAVRWGPDGNPTGPRGHAPGLRRSADLSRCG